MNHAPNPSEPTGWAEFIPARPVISYVWIVYKVLADPRAFFQAMPRESYYFAPAMFTVISFLIPALALVVMGKGTVLALLYFLNLVSWLMTAGLIHLVATRMVGGRGGFPSTFRAMAYTSFIYLVSPVPYLSLASQIFGLYLLAQGLSAVHGISKGRAATAMIIVLGGLLLTTLLLLGAVANQQ